MLPCTGNIKCCKSMFICKIKRTIYLKLHRMHSSKVGGKSILTSKKTKDMSRSQSKVMLYRLYLLNMSLNSDSKMWNEGSAGQKKFDLSKLSLAQLITETYHSCSNKKSFQTMVSQTNFHSSLAKCC